MREQGNCWKPSALGRAESMRGNKSRCCCFCWPSLYTYIIQLSSSKGALEQNSYMTRIWCDFRARLPRSPFSLLALVSPSIRLIPFHWPYIYTYRERARSCCTNTTKHRSDWRDDERRGERFLYSSRSVVQQHQESHSKRVVQSERESRLGWFWTWRRSVPADRRRAVGYAVDVTRHQGRASLYIAYMSRKTYIDIGAGLAC